MEVPFSSFVFIVIIIAIAITIVTNEAVIITTTYSN
jgi:hypothetical protein